MGAALFLVVAQPAPALAHASLLRADPPDLCSPLVIPRVPAGDPRCAAGQVLPSPPTTVRLFFNERVSPVGRGVRVLGPDGRRVDRAVIRLEGSQMAVAIDAAAAGTYLVTWRVVSRDTHPARGAFAFSVGHASRPPGGGLAAGGAGARSGTSWMDLALQALARAMHFAGYALGFGAFAFQVLVLSPLAPGAGAAERRVWRLVSAGVVLLLAAEPLALLAQTSSLGEGSAFDAEVIGGALESSFGRVLAQRLGAALLLWVLLGLSTGPGRRGRGGSIRADATVAILGVALAFIDGEAAHAPGARPVWVGMGANTLHVAAMGAWAGGVAALLSVWWLPEMAGSPHEGGQARGEVAARAGRVFAASLGVLAVTGTVMAVQHLGGPFEVLTNGYGRTLGVKLVMICVAMLLALAAMRVSLAKRGRWWGWETGALTAVLALAGLLVSLPPPR